MKSNKSYVLAINGGSSSIKFALYEIDDPPRRLLYGKIDRIGLPGTNVTLNGLAGNHQDKRGIEASNHRSAGGFLIDWLEGQVGFGSVAAVGHRIVHGGEKYNQPQPVTPELLEELHRISPYDPEHLPSEIELIDLFRERFPDLIQIACFDTAFHRTMPRVARLLPIPRRFYAMGVQRYGFHGLSYSFIMEELARLAGQKATQGRLVIAHLGNGASLAAVHGGKCIDTSMGFTPAAGFPMGSRSGDLDPGLVWYLAQTEKMSPKQFHDMVNHASGLLGVSEISSDMRDLLNQESTDIRAAEAIELFCYQVKKWIGSFAAALGGVDTIVFTGGIGENSNEVRKRICSGLDFLGIKIDEEKNKINAQVISAEKSPTIVRVIRTDEELMIAKTLCRILSGGEQTKEK